MGKCERCGNDYAKSFQVKIHGKEYTFDSFECAIQTLAPKCEHCGCRIIGHGFELNGLYYCCAHCMRHGRSTLVFDSNEDYTSEPTNAL